MTLHVRALVLSLLLLTGCCAEPLIRGVPNVAQVTPTLYRGGYPSRTGFANLKAAGIQTVVSLQEWRHDRDKAAAAGLRYFEVPMSPFQPRDEQIEQVLRIVIDPANQPVFVYCHLGGDRTGCAVAAHRIIEQGWSNEAAYRERTANSKNTATSPTSGGSASMSATWTPRRGDNACTAARPRRPPHRAHALRATPLIEPD